MSKDINIKKDGLFKTKMKNWLVKFSKFFDKLLFPDDIKCIFCGKDIQNFEERPYCEDCEKEVILNNGNRCIICDEPIDNEAVVCDECQKHKRNFKRAFCPFVYDGKVRSAILAYKDSNQRYKAKAFADAIGRYITNEKVNFDVITYVPLTAKKKKIRSFDQAELLARELAKRLNKPVVSMFSRVKDGQAQKVSTYKERQDNIKDMYVLKDTKLKKSQSVLIVDDIITTCATINFCAGLIANKVKDVYVCAVARNKLKKKDT
ncbi:MAG: ComF family protein [Candidatus Caccovivens sp.]